VVSCVLGILRLHHRGHRLACFSLGESDVCLLMGAGVGGGGERGEGGGGHVMSCVMHIVVAKVDMVSKIQ